MIEVIPAIIAHSQEELEQKIRQVENHVEKIHLDIMDGNFVSNTTVGIEELEKIQTNLKVQVHLMTSKPEEIVDKFFFIQFMTVHPGNYGGEFVESVLGKISSFHSGHPNVKILVDGAMHIDTAYKVVQAGASTIIVGGYIFSEGR